MRKINGTIVTLFTVISFISCSAVAEKESVLTIGKRSDKSKSELLDGSDIFTQNDTLEYILKLNDSYDADIITRRIYKGKEYIDLNQMESVDLKYQPNEMIIKGSIPVENLINKYGSGSFMLLFIVNKSVIAKRPFLIQPSNSYKALPDVSKTTAEKKKREMEIEKPLKPDVSPGDMMK